MKRKIIALVLTVIMLLSFHSTVSATVQDWNVTKGFGTVKGTGAGLSENEGNLTATGYGEMVFNQKTVEEAVAVQFKINAFPNVTHYFYFGLMDTSKMIWETAGAKAKGVVNRLVVSNEGQTLTGTVLNTSKTGTLTVNNGVSSLKALGTVHMVVFYKEADTWSMILDGTEIARIPHSSTALKDENHLIAGAYSSSTMEMEIQEIFVDGEVTQEMKDGSYISQVAGDSGRVDEYYDDEGRLIVGDAIITGSAEAPSYVVSNIVLVEEPESKALAPYLVMGAGVTALLSIVICVVHAFKKKTGREEDPHEK